MPQVPLNAVIALELYPRLKEYLQKSNSRLYDALKISVAGNVIDLGINKDFDIEDSIRRSLGTGFARDDFGRFKEKLDQVDDVLVVASIQTYRVSVDDTNRETNQDLFRGTCGYVQRSGI